MPYIPPCQGDFQATSFQTLRINLEQHRTHMAKKKVTKKAAPKKAAAKPAAPKPIKEALGKSGLVAYISDATGVASRDVRAVLGSLESAVQGSVSKKGFGSFTLPGQIGRAHV